MFYVRFTDDIERDMKSGYSSDFRSGEKMSGLCAWEIFDQPAPWASDAEIIEKAVDTARKIASNTYGGYSSSTKYAVLDADYVGSSNDGCCVKVNRVISVSSL